MASFEGRVSFSSLPKIEKSNTQFHYADDDFIDAEWPVHEGGGGMTYPSVSKAEKQDYSYQFPPEFDSFGDDTGYDSSQEHCGSGEMGGPPEVNLKNVLTGMIAIVTGRNKVAPGETPEQQQQQPTSNVSFLGAEKNGDTYLHSSVYTPSAPPLFEPVAFNYSAYKEILEAEPPEWLPDSSSIVCMQCTSPFTALTRGRHHCRFCGGIFCRTCSKGRCLLPVKFRERNPQRVCDACYDRLDPLQGILINSISNAAQAAKHDVMDWTCTRGWLNLPVGFSMEQEIYKATNTLRSYSQVSRLNPETSIHLAVLKGAKGLAILTVTKQVENSGCFIPEISEKNEVLRPKQVAQSTQKSLKQSWSRRRRFISFFFFFFFFFFRHCAQVTFRHERIASFENQGLHHWQQARAHTAVIYAAWAELKPIFFEGWMANDIAPGGQLAATSDVKNFPGFPEGILGMELMDRCWSQSVRFSTQIFTETVSKVDFSSTPFKVYTISKTVQADAVIVAITNRLVFPGSGEGKGGFWNRGISACAICDGAAPIFRNKPPLGGDPRR